MRRMFFRFTFFVAVLSSFLTAPLLAGAQTVDADVPEELKPWIPWVLHGERSRLCPFFQGEEGEPLCRWPSRLELVLDGAGGTFRQAWQVHDEGAVGLPGDAKTWPREVKLSGETRPVLSDGETPILDLPVGQHEISGSFFWTALPEFVTVPAATGLVTVTLNGKELANPYRDADGRLWLAPRQSREEEQEALILRVNRKFTDGVPFLAVTRIDLQAAGKAREAVLANPLLPGFSPFALESALPARLDDDGRLRVQVRPGHWTIEVSARHVGPLREITLKKSEGAWAEDELWAFEARSDLRVVDVTGLESVDPRQTDLPAEWRGLPAYRAEPGDKLVFAEKRRGHENPEPDRLELSRDTWLDFDGGGFSFRDVVAGSFNESWRLEMNPGLELGRVSLNGEDQFITLIPGSGKSGFEVRQGRASVQAEGRGLRTGVNLPAVGWDHAFDRASGVLHLPPGWSAFTATGVDKINGTWLGRWTLLDLFLLFVFTLSAGKLWGWKYGVLAFAALGLTLVETDAPRWLWLFVFVWQALSSALPEGTLKRCVRSLKYATLMALVLVAASFSVQELRYGLYPILDREGTYAGAAGRGFINQDEEAPDAAAKMAPASPPVQEAMRVQGAMNDDRDGYDAQQNLLTSMSSGRKAVNKKMYAYKQAVNQQVQTGFGLPSWDWAGLHYSWSGEIPANHEFGIYLVPPPVNLALAFARVLSLLFLIWKAWGGTFFKSGGAAAKALAVALAFSLSVAVAAPANAGGQRQAPPEKSVLEELRERLLERPECFPDCAQIAIMTVEVPNDTLTITLEIHATAETAVPLPGHDKDWQAERVTLNGSADAAVTSGDGGFLWLKVAPGISTAVLQGRLGDKNEVRIPFREKPRRVEVRAEGFTVSGLDEDGLPEETLTLNRLDKRESALGEGSGNALPPLVEVRRRLSFGLTWEVETEVARLSGPGQPVVLEIPLLAGESVLTDAAGGLKGKFRVNLGPQTDSVRWSSVLPITGELKLEAPASSDWAEVWELDVTPLWHAEFSGIPPVHPGQAVEFRQPTWRPWPGEVLTLKVVKPEGAPGPTLTVDKAAITVTPGLRSSDSRLDLSVRTSLGGQQVIEIPGAAEIRSVSVNGNSEPVRKEGDRVIVPLKPGAQNIAVEWKDANGLSARFRTPEVKLGGAVANVTIRILMPYDRWILWLCGPDMGAVVQYWGLVALILIAAFALGRLPVSMLRTHQWILLLLGLTQTSVLEAGLVIAWLLALGAAGRKMARPRPFVYDLRQIALVALSLVAFGILVDGIHQGLLGTPSMHVAGYGSSATDLNWYRDRAADALPRASAFSLPLLAYHVAMLAWGLWMAFSLIKWVKTGWKNMTAEGIWQPIVTVVKKTPPTPSFQEGASESEATQLK